MTYKNTATHIFDNVEYVTLGDFTKARITSQNEIESLKREVKLWKDIADERSVIISKLER